MPSDQVRIRKWTSRAWVERQTWVEHLGSDEGQSWPEVVTGFIEDAVATMAGLIAHSNPAYIDLSGGYDSRLIFGLSQALDADPSHLKVLSNPDRLEDLEIATSIANYFGRSIETPLVPIGELSVEESFETWLHGSAGGYLPVFPKWNRSPSLTVQFTGDKSATDNFGSTTARQLLGNLERQGIKGRRHDWLYEVKETMRRVGTVAGETPMPLLYGATRGRFHCGRNWYRRLGSYYAFGPMVSMRFARLYLDAERQGQDVRTVLPDVLTAVDPQLLAWGHPRSIKLFSREVLDGRRLAGRLPFDVKPKSVLGSAGNTRRQGKARGPSDRLRFLELLVNEVDAAREAVEEAGVENPEFLDAAEADVVTIRRGETEDQKLRGIAWLVQTGKLLELCR